MTVLSRSDLAIKMAIAAGEVIVSLDPRDGVVQKEGRGNIVTAADKASEKIIETAVSVLSCLMALPNTGRPVLESRHSFCCSIS